MSSDLQRIAQGLIDALNENPRAAADLNSAANQCMELAGQIAELAVILPEAAAAAEYLAEAARACGEAGQLVAGATVTGRAWAQDAVGGTPSGPVTDAERPAGRDAVSGGTAKPAGPEVGDDESGSHRPHRGSAGPDVEPPVAGPSEQEQPVRRPSGRPAAPSGGSGPPGERQQAGRSKLPLGPGPSMPRPPQDGGVADAQATIRRLPVRENDDGKTHGVWIDRDGQEKPLVSGVSPYSRLADKHAERLGTPGMWLTSHVEIKFAMLMRERGLRDETIYINNEVCRGLASCPQWIEAFLPPGAKLTVHWPGGGPWTFEGRESW